MRTTLLLGMCSLLTCQQVVAQYDTLWIGTPDGPSTSLANTPFPTGAALAARTQYLIRMDELQQAGLEQTIVGICFQVVDDDMSDPDCLVDLHVGMKNVVQAELVDFDQTGLWITASAPQVNLSAGVLGIPFNLVDFPWIGLNILVDVNYERGEQAGNDPRIMLRTGLDYIATWTGRSELNVPGVSISSTTPADVTIGSDSSLPVMGLLVPAVNTSVIDGQWPSVLRISPNPCDASTNIDAPGTTSSIQVLDAHGRTMIIEHGSGRLKNLDVSALPSGCYAVHAISVSGITTTGRLMKR